MATIAQTFSVIITDALYTISITTPTQLLNLLNLDTVNAIWVNYQTGVAAAAEADDNVCIRPGETIIIRRVPSFRAIAITGTVKLNVWGTDNI